VFQSREVNVRLIIYSWNKLFVIIKRREETTIIIPGKELKKYVVFAVESQWVLPWMGEE
jgi:hypothetical protein